MVGRFRTTELARPSSRSADELLGLASPSRELAHHETRRARLLRGRLVGVDNPDVQDRRSRPELPVREDRAEPRQPKRDRHPSQPKRDQAKGEEGYPQTNADPKPQSCSHRFLRGFRDCNTVIPCDYSSVRPRRRLYGSFFRKRSSARYVSTAVSVVNQSRPIFCALSRPVRASRRRCEALSPERAAASRNDRASSAKAASVRG